MTSINIGRNAYVPIQISQWVRNGKPVVSDLQNRLADDLGFAIYCRSRCIYHHHGNLFSAGASLIPASASTRDRARFAWHTGPYVSFVFIRFELAVDTSLSVSDPYASLEVNIAGSAVSGIAYMRAGSSPVAWNDVPSNFAEGYTVLVNPATSDYTAITLTPDRDYQAVIKDVGTSRLRSVAVWEISLEPDTSNGYAANNLGTGQPIFDKDRLDVATAARTLRARGSAQLWNWHGDTTATARTAALSSTIFGSAGLTFPSITIAGTGTVAVTTPTYQALGAFSSANGAASLQVDWPTHAVNDVAIMMVAGHTSGGAWWYPPTTWGSFTFLNSVAYDTGDGYYDIVDVYWARASSTSETSPVFSIPAGLLAVGQILTVRGCATTGSPVDAFDIGTIASTTTPSLGSFGYNVPTSVDNTLVISALGIRNCLTSANFSGWTNASLVSITERGDEGIVPDDTSNRYHRAIGWATGVKSTAGAITHTTLTSANTVTGVGIVVALKP